MQPASAFDFLRAARQRMDVSEEIFNRLRRNLEAQYLAGYVIECSLKAVILRLPRRLKRLKKLSSFVRARSGIMLRSCSASFAIQVAIAR